MTSQIVVILGLFFVFSGLIVRLLKMFKVGASFSIFFIVPLLIYSIGFIFRLDANKQLIDLGFYFTEYSSIFIYVLFSVFFFLGQIKYWRGKG